MTEYQKKKMAFWVMLTIAILWCLFLTMVVM